MILYKRLILFIIVQSSSCVLTPRIVACQAPLSSTMSQSLLKFMSIELVMLSSHFIFCHPFSFCPQSFPASGSFPMSWLLASGSQSIRLSASASVFSMNIQDWSPLGWTGLISLQSKGLSRVFSNTTAWNHKFFGAQLSLWSNSHIHTWLLEKPWLWPYRPLLAKWCFCFLIHYPHLSRKQCQRMLKLLHNCTHTLVE